MKQKLLNISVNENECFILLSWIYFLKVIPEVNLRKEDFKLQKKLIKKIMEFDDDKT